ncbi:hypothetical protein B0H13DRAFT_1996534 [Mycena leptocephala]|nr:hypothetical protein B0H13DRAFT_1996534 [Mycena leptocephala]
MAAASSHLANCHTRPAFTYSPRAHPSTPASSKVCAPPPDHSPIASSKSPYSTPLRAAVSDWVLHTIPLTFPILWPPPPFSSSSLPTAMSNKDIRKVTHLLLSPQRRHRALPPSETTRKRDVAFGGTRRSPPVLAVSAHKVVWKGKNCRHSWLPLIPPHPRLETPLPTRLAGSRLPRVQNIGVTSHDKVREWTRNRSKGWDYWSKVRPPASFEGKRFSKSSSPFVLVYYIPFPLLLSVFRLSFAFTFHFL